MTLMVRGFFLALLLLRLAASDYVSAHPHRDWNRADEAHATVLKAHMLRHERDRESLQEIGVKSHVVSDSSNTSNGTSESQGEDVNLRWTHLLNWNDFSSPRSGTYLIHPYSYPEECLMFQDEGRHRYPSRGSFGNNTQNCGAETKVELADHKEAVWFLQKLDYNKYLIKNHHNLLECLIYEGDAHEKAPQRFAWPDGVDFCGLVSQQRVLEQSTAVWIVEGVGDDLYLLRPYGHTFECLTLGADQEIIPKRYSFGHEDLQDGTVPARCGLLNYREKIAKRQVPEVLWHLEPINLELEEDVLIRSPPTPLPTEPDKNLITNKELGVSNVMGKFAISENATIDALQNGNYSTATNEDVSNAGNGGSLIQKDAPQVLQPGVAQGPSPGGSDSGESIQAVQVPIPDDGEHGQ